MLFSPMVEKYVETVVISIAAILLGYYTAPDDPLWVHAVFPWMWMIPVLIALRHGRIAAMIAVILMILGMLYSIHFLLFSWDAYQVWLFGGVTLTFVCAEYQAMWQRRQYSLNIQQKYLGTRLESLSRVYGVLRLSHDRLEEALILKPVTMREAFLQLRNKLLLAKGEFTKEIAQTYLELLAYHTNLEKAALYLYENKNLNIEPIAYIREKEILISNDVLVNRALRNKKTSFVSVNLLNENELSQYLAIVPMLNAEDQILGILTISDMSFMSLNNEILKITSVLLAYIADEYYAAKESKKLQIHYPQCPAYFSNELFKLAHMYKLAKIDSAIFAFYIFPHITREDILQLLHQEKRGLDIIWQTKKEDVIIFFVLMPLTERSMLKGYTDRMDNSLNKYGIHIGEKPIYIQHRQLSTYADTDIYSLLNDLINYDRF